MRLAVLLIDSRRGFLPPDLETLAQIVEKNFPILTILTKSDKISLSQQQNLIDAIQKQIRLACHFFLNQITDRARMKFGSGSNEAIKE